MENKSERTEPKSPWGTRSARKPKTPGVEENSNAKSYPKTPNKQLDCTTPSKTEGMSVGLTPRRSERKSIKPIHEYENIVAQKGLKSTVRSTVSEEDPVDEGKWVPAVVGRVSTKRGKKLARGRRHNLKKQKKCPEDSEASNAEDCDGLMEMEITDAINEENIEISAESVTKNHDPFEENQVETKNKTEEIDVLLISGVNKELQVKEKHMVIEQISKPDIQDTESQDNEKVDIQHGSEEVSDDVGIKKASMETIGFENKGEEAIDDKQESEIPETGKVIVEKDHIETEHNSKEDRNNSDSGKISLQNFGSEVEKQSSSIEHEIKVKLDETDPTQIVETINIDDSESSQDNKNIQAWNEAGPCEKITESAEQAIESVGSLFTDEAIGEQETKEKQTESTEKPNQDPNIKNTTGHEAVDFVDTEDNSTESGDVELLTMPVTADDSPGKSEIEAHSTLNTESSNTKSSDVSVYENVDDSDCIMLSLSESLNTNETEPVSEKTKRFNKLNESSNSTDMPSLLVCSDDEDMGTDKGGDKDSEADQPQQSDKSTKLDGTFDADQTPEKVTSDDDMQILRPSISHVPTPFKSKAPIIPDIIIEPEEDSQGEEPPIVVEVVREARLKSSRKRSFSACEDRPKRNVTFYSPANVTVAIYEGDLINSCKKDASSKKKNYRKRSLSVTETEKEMITYIKQKKTPESRKKQQQPGSRTKMPNFSAIHQQHFGRMESITDHVARKAERAKVLSNSALKAKPASSTKGISLKNTVLRDCNKDSKASLAMPKARQRIELSGIEHNPKKPEQTGWLNVGMKIRSKSRNDLSALDDLPSIDKVFKFNSSSAVFSASIKPKLPKPKMEPTVNKLNKTQDLHSKPGISTTTGIAATVMDTRPKFNLSTAPACQSFRSTETLDDRRKRLIDMYKSRNQPRTVEKNREILKGVRTNRRFELQMMSRNRPN